MKTFFSHRKNIGFASGNISNIYIKNMKRPSRPSQRQRKKLKQQMIENISKQSQTIQNTSRFPTNDMSCFDTFKWQKSDKEAIQALIAFKKFDEYKKNGWACIT